MIRLGAGCGVDGRRARSEASWVDSVQEIENKFLFSFFHLPRVPLLDPCLPQSIKA